MDGPQEIATATKGIMHRATLTRSASNCRPVCAHDVRGMVQVQGAACKPLQLPSRTSSVEMDQLLEAGLGGAAQQLGSIVKEAVKAEDECVLAAIAAEVETVVLATPREWKKKNLPVAIGSFVKGAQRNARAATQAHARFLSRLSRACVHPTTIRCEERGAEPSLAWNLSRFAAAVPHVPHGRTDLQPRG